MRYVGGKARIAQWVKDAVLSVKTNQTAYLEPFVGGANTLVVVAPHFTSIAAGDAREDLVLLYQAIGRGWVPPAVTKAEYHALKTAAPSAHRGFAGVGCSFGGKWFGGFVDSCWDTHHQRMTKVYADAARNSLLKHREVFARTTWSAGSYTAWTPRADTLVYCDPPYAGTLGYGTAFDSAAFWELMGRWRDSGVTVVVSEQIAPDGWRVLAERERKAQLRVARGVENEARLERLFY